MRPRDGCQPQKPDWWPGTLCRRSKGSARGSTRNNHSFVTCELSNSERRNRSECHSNTGGRIWTPFSACGIKAISFLGRNKWDTLRSWQVLLHCAGWRIGIQYETTLQSNGECTSSIDRTYACRWPNYGPCRWDAFVRVLLEQYHRIPKTALVP